MTRIGLLSDTHGDLPGQLFNYFKEVDEIWHAGDIGDLSVTDEIKKFKPLRAVFGNIDDQAARLEFPEFQLFQIEEVKVLITHIGGKPGKHSAFSHQLIAEHRPHLFICGHSHIALVQHDKPYSMLWINPGAAGNKGFHPIKTMMRFCINGDRIEQLELIELGKRSALHNSVNK